jgi:predicted RNA polymerase sigma factor
VTGADTVEDLLRELAPQVLAALVRRYGQFHLAEEATQEALLAAAEQWPAQLPSNPRGWLVTVATHRLIDEMRSDQSRRLRELAAPNPFTTLNRAVAVGEVHGPRAGLDVLDGLGGDKRVASHHRLFATRAHLQEKAGDRQAAAVSYQQAARLATSVPERRFLATQARRLDAGRLNRPL